MVPAKQDESGGLAATGTLRDPEIDADDRFDAGFHGGTVELDHRKQVALVSHRDGRHHHPGRRLHQWFDTHGTVRQRIFRVYTQVNKGGGHELGLPCPGGVFRAAT